MNPQESEQTRLFNKWVKRLGAIAPSERGKLLDSIRDDQDIDPVVLSELEDHVRMGSPPEPPQPPPANPPPSAQWTGFYIPANSRVGPFVVEGRLGQGGMGTVYRARYEPADRKFPPVVALKIVAPQAVLSAGEQAATRFKREASILQQLRHPNITRIYATGTFRETNFIVMEYVDGESLEKPPGVNRQVPWEEVCRLGRQLCSALQHAHDKGILHRDLKPSNLLIDAKGALKLADFGIAKDADVTALTSRYNALGTAPYMSPEQCMGERTLTGKSDLYSLGVVFYELLAGRKPFDADTSVQMFMMHVNEVPLRPRRRNPEVPPKLETLVMMLMEKRPEHRPRDAAMVEMMLAEIEEEGRSPASIASEAAARAIDSPPASSHVALEHRGAMRTIDAGSRRKHPKSRHDSIRHRSRFGLLLAAITLAASLGTAAWLAWGGPRNDSGSRLNGTTPDRPSSPNDLEATLPE